MPDPAVPLAMHDRRTERIVLVVLAAVQFISIVDFMVVMPLGPRLMDDLQIGPDRFGLIVASYTFAAGAAGLVASAIVDRFSRRAAFMSLYAGFLLGTLCCALAPTYHTLLAARVVTGAFGGILGGMAMAIIGDVFPEERRGHATGALMSAFALASVVGVPIGIFLGTNYGWHVPFVALAVLGLPVLALAPFVLPALRGHLNEAHVHPLRSVVETFSVPNHLNAFALIAILMLGSFAVFPYLSAYLVANVGMTEQQLPIVYIVGGGLTLFTAPWIGKLADRHGKLTVYRWIAPLSALCFVVITQLPPEHLAFAVAVFGALMVVNSGRMIAAMAMVTSSVQSHRRGGFMSANSSMQHVSSGFGAYLGGLIIEQAKNGPLTHFAAVGWLAGAATLVSLWLAGRIRTAEDVAASDPLLNFAAAAEATFDVGEPLMP